MTAIAEENLIIPKQRERVTNREWRRANASIAVGFFAPRTVIINGNRGELIVSWEKRGTGEAVFRRWQCRHGQDFYPTWSRLWGHGGTACTALAQLIRWIQGRPVLPMSTWRYWAGEKCRLAREDGDELIARLTHANYPEHAHCVLCGRELHGLDWWNLDGVSGPCCSWTNGCRQSPTQQPNPKG